MTPSDKMEPQEMTAPHNGMSRAGHLYMQTNEVRNCIIHYLRSPDGTITEAERVFTGGSGSGGYNPIVDGKARRIAFEGARSVILSPDQPLSVHHQRRRQFGLELRGRRRRTSDAARRQAHRERRARTEAAARSRSPTTPSTGTLYVLHALGPDHLRLMSVDSEGRLTARPERYTVNTPDKPNRVATMVALSPDAQFLIVGTTFDEPAKPNPDGSPILWVSPQRRRAALDRVERA